jgi:hypothetical protein
MDDEWILSKLGQGGAPSRLQGVGEPLRAAGAFGSGEGEEPVEIGVLEPGAEMTGLAGVTRTVGGGALAGQQLAYPEGEPLLPHAAEAVNQERCRD